MTFLDKRKREMTLQLDKLLEFSTVGQLRLNTPIDIKGIASDSRLVQDGYLFAALSGSKQNGTDFISDAVAKGASAVLVQKGTTIPQIVLDKKCVVLESENPRDDLSRIAANFYPKMPENIFAVTGTNGKTSTVWFTSQLLEMNGQKSASLGTIGLFGSGFSNEGSLTTLDPITLHKTLQECAEGGVETLCMEASSHGLDQHRLHNVPVKRAAFTNLTLDHLDYHGTMDTYFDAKTKLFTEVLVQGGTAVIDTDSEYGEKLAKICEARNIKTIQLGYNGRDIKINNRTITQNGQTLDISVFGKNATINLPLIGEFQATNALAAFALSGLDASQIQLLEKLSPVPGRMEYVGQTENGAMIYVDYAHTPDALENVLTSARPHTENKLHVVFGCGGDRDKSKRPLMGKLANDLADNVIVCDDNPRTENADSIRQQILAASPKAVEIADREKAIETAIQSLNKGDILIIAGKGHEDGQKVNNVVHPFHDPSVAKKILNKNKKTIEG